MIEAGVRRAGVCLHVSSLAGGHGIGDVGPAARRFIDWMRSAGLSVWQFLPLGPTGYGNSPYQPVSVFARNPLLIDLEALCELDLIEPGELPRSGRVPDARVDFGRVIADKQRCLGLAAARFEARADRSLRDACAEFCAREDAAWLHDFALFATLKARHGQAAWYAWEPRYRSRDPAALGDWLDREREAVDAVKRVQFLFATQWQALRDYARRAGITLFGDMPIYLAHDCAEAWSHPELLCLDADGMPEEIAGVPPDYFSADGQRWGNPLYRWEVHAGDGYAWWTARLRHALETVDLVRLDHFRGFDAYWAIPVHAPTRAGQWKPGPGEALFRALQAELGSVPIVAEDLGIITESVTSLRRAFGIPGMHVLQFMVGDEDFDPGSIEPGSACYTGTHDNDTAIGWFRGSGRDPGTDLGPWQQQVLAQTGADPDTVHIGMIEVALRSAAGMAIAPMQDFLGLGSEARLNWPGREDGNWEWRLGNDALDRASPDGIRVMIEASDRVTEAY